MTRLEDLAHHSAGSARDSVADLPIPSAPGRGKSRRVAAAAVALAGAAAIIALVVSSGGGQTPVDVAGSPTSLPGNTTSTPRAADGGPYFEFDVPEGWTLTVRSASDDPEGMARVNAAQFYGAGSGDLPFSDADLMIKIFELPEGIGQDEIVDGDIIVRGRPGESSSEAGGFESISWRERGSLLLTLRSHQYDANQLIGIADGISVDGFSVTLPDPPDNLALVASIGWSDPDESSLADLWAISITDPDSRTSILLSSIHTYSGLLELDDHPDPSLSTVEIAVRGTRGVLGRGIPDESGQESSAILWMEEGQAMFLAIDGTGDPVDVANSLQRISRTRFEELLAAHPAPTSINPLDPSAKPDPLDPSADGDPLDPSAEGDQAP